VFIGTIATVMLLGGARLALNSPSSQTVRVASISRREVGTSAKPGNHGPHVVRQRLAVTICMRSAFVGGYRRRFVGAGWKRDGRQAPKSCSGASSMRFY